MPSPAERDFGGRSVLGPFLFGALIHITIYFTYLLPFGSPPILAVLACLYVIYRYLAEQRTLDRGLVILFVAWLGLIVWAVLYRLFLTGELGSCYRVASYYFSGFLLIIATVCVVRGDERRLTSLLLGLNVIALIGLAISFLNYYTSFFLGIDFLVDLKREGSLAQFHRSRMMGTVGNPNNFAIMVLVSYAVLLAYLAERMEWKKTALFVLCAIALIFASSRGVLIGAALIFVLACWVALKHRNFFAFSLLLLLPTALSLILLVLGSDVARIDQLIDRIQGQEGAASIDIRFEIWAQYLNAFFENPSILLLGNGLNNYPVESPAENAYIKLINEFGLPVTMILVALVTKLAFELGRHWQTSVTSRMGFFLIVSLMLANISNEFIDGRSFWLALGIAYACLLIQKTQTSLMSSPDGAREAGSGPAPVPSDKL